MIHRIKKKDDMHAGKWNGLGGKFELGESPEDCARREIQEESGLIPKKLLLKGVLTFPDFADSEDWYAFVFLVPKFEGQLIDSQEGVLKWIPNEELLDLNLWEGDRIFLPWLDQSEFFSGRFVYKEGEFIDYEVEFYPAASF